MFCRGLVGPWVWIRPQVMSGAASSGQQVWMGKCARLTASPSSTRSWQGAERTRLGAMSSTFLKIGRDFHASFRPLGGSGSLRKASRRPISRRSSSDSPPMPSATRSTVPNRLASTGVSWPLGFSNSRAGPPARRTRSAISVISSLGSTSVLMRLSRPRCSRSAMNSRRSAWGMGCPGVVEEGMMPQRCPLAWLRIASPAARNDDVSTSSRMQGGPARCPSWPLQGPAPFHTARVGPQGRGDPGYSGQASS